MPRRNRRPSPSPSSGGEELVQQPSSTLLDAIPASSSAQLQAPDSLRDLDSALQALADRADDLSGDEDSSLGLSGQNINEVVENYVSDAGFGLPSTGELPAAAEDLPQDDCILVGFSRVENSAIENKLSNALVLDASETAVIQARMESTENEQRKLIERYQSLKLLVDAGLQEMLQAPKALQLSNVSQILNGILSSMPEKFPSADVNSVTSVEGKFMGASNASMEKNKNSVLPPQGASEFTRVASEAKHANSPHLVRDRIVLTEAATTVLWNKDKNKDGDNREVFSCLV